MSIESQLREKLRKIEALFRGCRNGRRAAGGGSGAGTCAGAFDGLGRQDPSIEMQFSMPDQWSRHLFLALCRRYRPEAVSLLSAAAQHGHGSRTETVPRSSSVAGVLRA